MDFPKYLSIQTTSLCNASCVFCPYKDIKDLFPKKIMDMRLFKKIIDECSNHENIERIILYMNNEPLTDPHIIERINYTKEKVPWASVHILTNGLLLTDEMRKELINSKLDWIGISFHGIKKETIKKAMGINFDMAFERINRFIEEAKKRKNVDEYIMITFLKHKYLTDEEKEEAIKYWKKKGLKRISYFAGPISRAGNVKDLPQVYHKEKIVGCRSIWTEEMIHITEDGKVILCCMDWKRKVILGDLNKESIYKVWNGRRRNIWKMIYGKERMPENFLCRRCEEAKLEVVGIHREQKEKVVLVSEKQNNLLNKKEDKKIDLFLAMAPPWQTKMIPLGIAYLSSFLQKHNIKVKIKDLNVELFNSSPEEKKYFWDIATINSFTPAQLAEKFIQSFKKELDRFIEEIINSSIKAVGFSTTVASINVAIYLAHRIKLKRPEIVTILGGPGCFWNTYDIDPERLVDIFVIGEGEKPLLEICKRLQESNNPSQLLSIPGTIVCLDKQYFSYLPPDPIRNLDEIPFPKFTEFNLEAYNQSNTYKPLPLLISRGCINKCSFCIDHKMNYPFRIKKPESVIEEIKFYIDRYGVREFEFNDLLCNGSLKQLEEICNLIIRNNMKIQWTSYAVIREGMSLELCKKMKEAGCRFICYGLESASNRVLKSMNKRYTAEIAERVIRNTHCAGIKTAINIIIGHPGDSEKEFKNTCNFIKRNKNYIDQVTNISTCFLMPNTDLVAHLDKYGVYFKKSYKNFISYILGNRKFVPNYREFYAYPDNTPSRRVKWLRKFVKLLYQLDIPYVIVNYVKEHDRKFEQFIQGLGTNKKVLRYRNLKVDVSQKGRCKIFCINKEITQDVGMNSSFCIEGRWIDASSADWNVRKINNCFDIDIKWKEAPVIQKWKIILKKNYLVWRIETSFYAKVNIIQHKIGIMLSALYNKYEWEDTISNFPDSFRKTWQDLLFAPGNKIKITSSNNLFPSIILASYSKKKLFLQVQNSALPLQARMVNFCFLDNNSRGQEFGDKSSLEMETKIYFQF